jgi:V-type H+-transporting ATPase subunit C
MFQVELMKFKMGNLDSLMFINDNLIKQDTTIESLLKKIER